MTATENIPPGCLPFDLEKAEGGHPLRTGENNHVTDFGPCADPLLKGKYPYQATVHFSNGTKQLVTFTGIGSQRERRGRGLNDLFLVASHPALPEGFNPWFSGECPVDSETEVVVVYGNGAQGAPGLARRRFWKWDEHTASNIIGWKLAETPAPKEEPWYPKPGDRFEESKDDGVTWSSPRNAFRDLTYFKSTGRKYRPASPLSPQPGANGWIAHNGGPMPVLADILVTIKLRNGEIRERGKAADASWPYPGGLHSAQYDIVAYKLEPTPAPLQPPAGKQWHNPAGLKDAGEGYRFLLSEEVDGRYASSLGKDGKAELWSQSEQRWRGARNSAGADANNPHFTYRVPVSTPSPPEPAKPEPPSWTLGRHLPGFRALQDGEKWHRSDFTQEMLPDGKRPLLLGESRDDNDEIYLGREWVKLATLAKRTSDIARDYHYLQRTRRPLPSLPPGTAAGSTCNRDGCCGVINGNAAYGAWCPECRWRECDDDEPAKAPEPATVSTEALSLPAGITVSEPVKAAAEPVNTPAANSITLQGRRLGKTMMQMATGEPPEFLPDKCPHCGADAVSKMDLVNAYRCGAIMYRHEHCRPGFAAICRTSPLTESPPTEPKPEPETNTMAYIEQNTAQCASPVATTPAPELPAVGSRWDIMNHSGTQYYTVTIRSAGPQGVSVFSKDKTAGGETRGLIVYTIQEWADRCKTRIPEKKELRRQAKLTAHTPQLIPAKAADGTIINVYAQPAVAQPGFIKRWAKRIGFGLTVAALANPTAAFKAGSAIFSFLWSLGSLAVQWFTK